MSDNIEEKYLPVGARPIKRERSYFKQLWWQFTPYYLILFLILVIVVMVTVPLYVSGREEAAWERMKTILPQAEPLIWTIKKYTLTHGTPPPSLKELSMDVFYHLPEPEAGLIEHWHYEWSPDPLTGGWELSVRIGLPRGILLSNFSYLLVYHPSERYKEKDHGGTLRREGKWGWYYD